MCEPYQSLVERGQMVKKISVPDLKSAISNQNPEVSDLFSAYVSYLDYLKDERRKNYFSEMFDIYKKAYMHQEKLKLASRERDFLESKHGLLNASNSAQFEVNIRHLGNYYCEQSLVLF